MLASVSGARTSAHPDRPRPLRALVVSGSFGAGHDAAAHVVADQLTRVGVQCVHRDVVDLYPAGLGRAARSAYLEQLRIAPRSWAGVLDRLGRPSGWSRLAGRVIDLAAPRTLRAVEALVPDLVVSTHPFASQVLGGLRASGRLGVPVATYLTDMSVHPLWVHTGVDLHLALHALPAGQARRLGGSTEVVASAMNGPARTRRALRDESASARLRARLGLPVGVRLALVTGGAHGIGDLERAAADIAATGLAHPVVLCGRNRGLHDRLRHTPGVTALGWRDDVPGVLAAVDVVVQNAGGFTSQQALAAGVPQVSYRCIPGHGETNAEALERGGLVPWARTPLALADALRRALDPAAVAPARARPVLGIGDLPVLLGLALDRVPVPA